MTTTIIKNNKKSNELNNILTSPSANMANSKQIKSKHSYRKEFQGHDRFAD